MSVSYTGYDSTIGRVVGWQSMVRSSPILSRTMSRDVGSAAVCDRQVGEQTLTFLAKDDGTFTDTGRSCRAN
ncbi:MAG: hypothetical protein R3C14_46380 [Caldilineaceae bacterium]